MGILAKTLKKHIADDGYWAESRGSVLGHKTLERMLAKPDQGSRLQVLESALTQLTYGPKKRRVRAGFALALVNALEKGLGLEGGG
ncbi:hypothetical protein [Roseateles oligotrophus]|uniref:Uncharacterized protein n=1 Tax=Roseateles oligotrophus TaxID=1769250 RepID=A0ABT2YAV2_9BURK|nr:hypothetical protein [Roseateles oligotrophus]MCV2367431.1 hypothetical protein [Roseateles oligotrophus]